MTHPSFSALLLLHGDEPATVVDECLQSLAAQSWLPAQVVVAAIGPLPSTLMDMFERWCPGLPLQILALPPGTAEGPALAAGLLACTEAFVAHVDPQGVSQPWRFERQVDFLHQNPQFALCGSAMWEADPATLQPVTRRHAPETDAAILAMLPYRNPFHHETVVLRRDAVLAAGNYGGVPYAEDYALWLRLLAGEGKGWNLQDELVLSRGGSGLLRRAQGRLHASTEYRLYRAKRTLHIHNAVGAAAVFIARLVSHLLPPRWFSRAERLRRQPR